MHDDDDYSLMISGYGVQINNYKNYKVCTSI